MPENTTQQQFGGDWTVEKLDRVEKYLRAYTTALKKFSFRTFYIDAFAGTGYNSVKQETGIADSAVVELTASDTRKFLDGSARRALQVEPRFNKFVFIEKNPDYFQELQVLKKDFSNIAKDMQLINEDANNYITRFCTTMRSNERAVLFLDPFGMQVSWQTIENIAKTGKIDLWYLFPLGMGVNRMLKKDGKISEGWRNRLNIIFGTTEWFEAFYRPNPQMNMFEDPGVVKDADENNIIDFLIQRFSTIFPAVAKNPLILRNSKGSPLYLLCFAAGREDPALRIAQDILRVRH